MRPIIITLCLFVGLKSPGQSSDLIFTNFGTPISFGIDTFYSSKIHQVILHPNSTYEFNSFPHTSCLTWKQYKGSWSKNNDTLFFSDKYEIEEDDVIADYNSNSNQFFLISFKTDKGSVLRNKKIKVQYVYDFDAHLDEPEVEFTIRPDNTIKIPFNSIQNLKLLSAIRIEYDLNFFNKWYDYLTQNNPLNKKKESVPNVISVTFIENPKKEMVFRTIKGIIQNNMLVILSTTKSKTALPDGYREIEFEPYYSLKK